ncbi:hypothetical protein [Piscirickettsia litoralis]|uniref:Alpha/beta hydrolase n=1 Tax=Piscirickettsia litoralis TaxID=1891921 RepID=A0ABX3A9Z6_9GAMM|nr:hypothetical protein [Piscirickettsia litoralis]ODN42944.1 hypothetical protein BGC07_08445 [Piscirickettsia litoralis]
MRYKFRLLKLIILVGISFLLLGCASHLQRAEQKAKTAGFRSELLSTKHFTLISFYRISAGAKAANVYIEGDGLAWLNRYSLSTNPTPRDDLVLELALSDPALNVVYIARPCQYVPFELNPSCTAKYWSSHRFAPEVVNSISDALDLLKIKFPNLHYHLIGYSGGGAVAALLAASRKDVLSLTTLAGNLDHVAVNRHHEVNQMPESLNAIDIAEQLKQLPQRHFVGIKDDIVPMFIAKRFLAKMNSPACSVLIPLAVTHHEGWRDVWPQQSSIHWSCQPMG